MTTGPFIDVSRGLLDNTTARVPLALARFDAAAFAPGLFLDHGIYHPPALQGKALKRQADYLAGRICARTLLDDAGFPGFAVHSADTRAPLWPAGMVGSISHKSRHAAAAVYPRVELAGIGIDIETVLDPARADRIAGAIMTPAELARVQDGAGPDEAALRTTLVFSAKESFFKAAFADVGDWFGFDAVEVEALDPARRRLDLRCVKTLAPRFAAGARFTAGFRMVDASTVLTAVLVPAV